MVSFTRIAVAVTISIAVVAVLFLRFGSERNASWAKTKHPDSPEAFAYKTGWYAVRSQDPDAVAEALSIRHIQAANWQSGLKTVVDSNSRLVFITPPIRGWTLAVGTAVMLDGDAGFEQRLLDLSKRFGEAQYFASMRVSSAYMWARARSGKLECEFQTGDGSPIIRRGNAREVEAQLGLKFFEEDSPESNQPGYYDRKDLTYPDEADVLTVAQLWSVNPIKIGDYPEARYTGLIGRYPR